MKKIVLIGDSIRIGNAVLGCICPVLGLEWEA